MCIRDRLPTMKFFKKSYTYAACFGLLLTSSFSYSMLKTFVLSDAIQTVKATTTDTKAAKKAAASATTTDTSYSDDNIQVTLTEKTVENTQVYIADITVSSSDYLKTAFAQNTYGTNVTAKTSVTAANNSAILAVNGDYYGANLSLIHICFFQDAIDQGRFSRTRNSSDCDEFAQRKARCDVL